MSVRFHSVTEYAHIALIASKWSPGHNQGTMRRASEMLARYSVANIACFNHSYPGHNFTEARPVRADEIFELASRIGIRKSLNQTDIADARGNVSMLRYNLLDNNDDTDFADKAMLDMLLAIVTAFMMNS